MKTVPYFLMAIAILCSCTATTDQVALKSEIENANKEFMQAVSSKDADAVADMYTDDARLMLPNMPSVQGRENMKAFFQQTSDAGITDVKLTTEEVSGTDDFAVESGRYVMLAGDQKVDEGKYLVHWKKVGGKWLLHRDMPSTDLAVPQSMAQTGQTVGISVFKVKKQNDMKFEDFVNNVLTPSADVSTPELRAAVKSIRLLKANTVAKDGTHTYIFIFDPRSDKMNYDIEQVLVTKHGKEKGLQLYRDFGNLVTGENEYFDMEQLRTPGPTSK